MLTLAPRSQRAFSNFRLPIVQGIEKLPGSLSLGGSFFFSSALLSSVNITVSCSAHFLFFVNISFRYFVYLGICASTSATGCLCADHGTSPGTFYNDYRRFVSSDVLEKVGDHTSLDISLLLHRLVLFLFLSLL